MITDTSITIASLGGAITKYLNEFQLNVPIQTIIMMPTSNGIGIFTTKLHDILK
ncbi:hypothetical protein ACQKNX_04145 [Lysinibacillus sp. NPDC093712]|uniref:hypothetical protein n=1 Tax=Lysinibacillus sp. NPDC093712 TaxID=3390579 RepID=UPI003D0608AC